MNLMSVRVIRKKKHLILWCAALLSFFTSMNKILVPGSVFSDMQADLGFSANTLASMGAAFMYCYAASQLVLGLLSAKFGGVRVLLTGGSAFAAGCILFPFLSDPYLMIAVRGLTGLGAGTVFIGLAKLTADIYPKRFSAMLGLFLFIGYLGPVTAGYPFVSFVRATSWRTALLTNAVIVCAGMLLILLLAPGVLKKIRKNESILAPLVKILCCHASNFLDVSSMIIFGCYYAVLTTFGQKALGDYCQCSSSTASLFISCMAVLVAACNLGAGAILKLFREKRRRILLTMAVLCLAGTALGGCVFALALPAWLVMISFILLAVPAGCFPLYGTIAKELNPPESVGLSVAMLNFFAFVGIAIGGNISGAMLAKYESQIHSVLGKAVQTAQTVQTAIHYPPAAYRDIFLVFTLFAALGLVFAFFVPETCPKQERK